MARTKHAASRLTKKKPTGPTAKKVKINGDGKVRKKHRYRPGTVALREIRQYQKGANLLIPKAPFRRLVREIAGQFNQELRFGNATFEAIQNVAEANLVNLFRDTNKAAVHANRVGINKRDMDFAIKQNANQSDK